MPSLLDIPGYGGYVAKRQMNEQQGMQELQQAGALVGLQKHMRDQELERAFKADVQALGPSATQEQLAQVAAKYASPDKVLSTQQQSLDRKATVDATAEAARGRLAVAQQNADQMHQFRLAQIQNIKDENQRRVASDAEVARHNKALEELRSELLKIQGAAAGQKAAPKPIPSSALKLQQEELDAIGTASGISKDLGAVIAQLSPQVDSKTGAQKPPELDLGLFRNMNSEARQFLGTNDEVSRRYGSFKATLEKLRNDSLRLNKGVQTEGDAVRAWNELMARINDPVFVKQRLGEIQAINDRAVTFRKLNVDNIRRNYGHEPMDTSGYTNISPAVGSTGNQPRIVNW